MFLNVLKEVVKLPIDIEYATAVNNSLKFRYFTSIPDFDLEFVEFDCCTLTRMVEGGFVTEVTFQP